MLNIKLHDEVIFVHLGNNIIYKIYFFKLTSVWKVLPDSKYILNEKQLIAPRKVNILKFQLF